MRYKVSLTPVSEPVGLRGSGGGSPGKKSRADFSSGLFATFAFVMTQMRLIVKRRKSGEQYREGQRSVNPKKKSTAKIVSPKTSMI